MKLGQTSKIFSCSLLIFAIVSFFSSSAFAGDKIEHDGFYFQLGGGAGSSELKILNANKKSPLSSSSKGSSGQTFTPKTSGNIAAKGANSTRSIWPNFNLGFGLSLADFASIGATLDWSLKKDPTEKQLDNMIRAVANVDFYFYKFVVGAEGGLAYYYVIDTSNLSGINSNSFSKQGSGLTAGASAGMEIGLGGNLALDVRAYYENINFKEAKLNFNSYGLKALFRWY